MDQKIVSKPWNYSVAVVDGRNILSIICGTVGIFEVKIPISDSELAEVLSSTDETPPLVARIRRHPDSYRDREI